MKDTGNRCDLIGYDGQGHGFFNAGRKGEEYYEKTVAEMDKFLTSIGFINVEQAKTGSSKKPKP